MFVSAGSNRQQATSPSASSRSRPSRSLISTTRVVWPGRRGADVVRPRLRPSCRRGRRRSRRPSRGSTSCGRAPSGRPVASRASRIVNRLASVAVSANCQLGSPKRRVISSPHPDRVLGREHQRRPAAHLLATAATAAAGRMAGHRARVAQAEVDVLVPVDVAEPRPGRLLDEDRERARPLGHPVHRDAGEERAAARARTAPASAGAARRTAPRGPGARRGGLGRRSRRSSAAPADGVARARSVYPA